MNNPDILKYLQQNKIDTQKVFWMTTNFNGKLLDIGTVGDLLVVIPVVGKNVEKYIPALVGIFPVTKNIYLPNIQITTNLYYNIHIVLSNSKVYILFHNVTGNIDIFINAKPNFYDKISLLQELDYYILKQENDKKYNPVGNPPTWLHELFSKEESIEDIDDICPFLSGFLLQIQEYSPSTPHKHYSGIWTQNKTNGEEIYLNAWVIQHPSVNYLLIHPVDFTETFGENIIQLARENNLAYEQLQKTKEQLSKLVSLKDQFVNIISHDFRSPIATLISGISFLQENLQRDYNLDASNSKIISQIKSELHRLLEYNNKLYEWTRYNVNTLEVNLETLSFEDFAMDLIFQFETRLHAKNITLTPIIETEKTIQTDSSLLTQVLINLLDNAIKFSNEGSEIQLIIDDKSIRVADQGIGLTEDQIKQLKKGYYMKSHKGTKGERGTGLGMNIVSRILRTLNYTIDIQSELGKGSTFIVNYSNN